MGKSSGHLSLQESEDTSSLPDHLDDCFTRLCEWNSCAGQTLRFNDMCNPPSWKSSEGEDVEGDHSVWDSEEEEQEESDFGPRRGGGLLDSESIPNFLSMVVFRLFFLPFFLPSISSFVFISHGIPALVDGKGENGV